MLTFKAVFVKTNKLNFLETQQPDNSTLKSCYDMFIDFDGLFTLFLIKMAKPFKN